jgi:hypothetical protein
MKVYAVQQSVQDIQAHQKKNLGLRWSASSHQQWVRPFDDIHSDYCGSEANNVQQWWGEISTLLRKPLMRIFLASEGKSVNQQLMAGTFSGLVSYHVVFVIHVSNANLTKEECGGRIWKQMHRYLMDSSHWIIFFLFHRGMSWWIEASLTWFVDENMNMTK